MPATAYLKDFIVRAVAATDYFYFGSTANGSADSKALISTLFTSPTLTSPVLGAATGTSLALSGVLTAASFNKVAITAPATSATLTIANGGTLATTGAFSVTLAVGANVTLTVPTTSATLARTDAAQTFTGTQTFSGAIAGAAITATSLAVAGAAIVTSAAAQGLVSGPNGGTNPVFETVNNVASAATGIRITGNAAAAGSALAVISSGTNENLSIDAKGSGTVTIGGTSTGNIVLTRATTGASLSVTGAVTAFSGTAVAAGGTAGVGLMFSSTANFGLFAGTGAPTLSAGKGSIYVNTTAAATNTRMYINTDGGTTWTHFTSNA